MPLVCVSQIPTYCSFQEVPGSQQGRNVSFSKYVSIDKVKEKRLIGVESKFYIYHIFVIGIEIRLN